MIGNSVRGASGLLAAAFLILLGVKPIPALALPAVFWTSQPVAPGDAVMLYGAQLDRVRRVSISRLQDQPPGLPTGSSPDGAAAKTVKVPALQSSVASVKFILPQTLQQGIFSVAYGGTPVLLGVPQIDWCQPTRLLPGLEENEAAPGSSVQIIGRNFALTPTSASVRAALQYKGRIVLLSVSQVDKYSIVVRLPRSLASGTYELWVHNGHGGPQGWGGGLTLKVKAPDAWPATQFNIKDFGAHGDNINDDSEPLRRALEAAQQNGGGVIFFPSGTYRFNGWFFIPKRVVLRGADRSLSFLKWRELRTASTEGFIPAVLYSGGEFGIENLTIVAMNALSILHDLSWDAAQSANAPVVELQPYLGGARTEHDIFLCNVDFQLLYYATRSANPQVDPRWFLNGFGWKDNELVKLIALDGIRNLEISHCRFVGGTQRILDAVNARIVSNRFDNQWATLSWTDLGGQNVIFQNNILNGASSWRAGLLVIRHIYCAYNRSNNIVSGEREALTFDINSAVGRLASTDWNGLTLSPVKPWQGHPSITRGNTMQLADALLVPHSYHDLALLILKGPGAGQYRQIIDNSKDSVTLSAPWTVAPEQSSILLAFQLPGQCIFYRNQAEDTSVLGQIWGFLYDCTFEANRTVRSQGMWGLSGWFIQWLNNELSVAATFHEGVGPAGEGAETTPEGGAPYGFLGFTIAGWLASQPVSLPYVRACVIRGNHLSYGHRILIMSGYGGVRKQVPDAAAHDVIIDANVIEHSRVGLELDANMAGVLLHENRFKEVPDPMRLAQPAEVLVLQ
jgi:hypothetical protein